MSRRCFEFYALPDEQRHWLGEVLADKGVWCVLRQFEGPRVVCPTGAEFLSDLKFEVDQSARFSLILGHRELVPAPIWRVDGAGKRDIDFTRSEAIQYDPAVVARGSVLLEGQLAIMSKGYYDDLDIDSQPLQKWFNRVARSFARLKAPGAVLVHHTTLGTTKELRGVVLTPGAVAWRKEGRQLKQLIDGAVEFDIRTNQE
jgi:hypothetical protein